MGRFICLCAVSLAATTGCHGSSGPRVSGSVTYNGAPVESGFVAFSPTGAGKSFGAKITGGKYQAEKAPIGPFRILVTASDAGEPVKTREEAEERARSRAGKPDKSANYIREDAQGNGQVVEIKDGAQTIDLALSGSAKQ
jgi:hypothetical protein